MIRLGLGLGLGLTQRGITALPFYALSFDGGDYASMDTTEQDGLFDIGTESFTLALWVKTTDDATEYNCIMGAVNGPSWTSTGVRFSINFGVQGTYLGDGSHSFGATGNITVADGEWHHIAYVIDRTNQLSRHYVDGVSAGSASISTIGSLTTGVTYGLGCLHDNGTLGRWPFDGELADIRVYTGTALDTTALAAIMAETAPRVSGDPAPSAAWATDPDGTTGITSYVGDRVWTFGASAAKPTLVGPYITLPPEDE